jgi:hypothetical protein
MVSGAERQRFAGLALVLGALAADHVIDAVIGEDALQSATSARSGTFSSVSLPSVSRLAIIRGSVAFFGA